MAPEWVAYALAAIGVLALLASLLHHIRADRREADLAARRAKAEREQFHDLTQLMQEVSTVVVTAAARAEDKLAALERVLKHADQRTQRITRLMEKR